MALTPPTPHSSGGMHAMAKDNALRLFSTHYNTRYCLKL